MLAAQFVCFIKMIRCSLVLSDLKLLQQLPSTLFQGYIVIFRLRSVICEGKLHRKLPNKIPDSFILSRGTFFSYRQLKMEDTLEKISRSKVNVPNFITYLVKWRDSINFWLCSAFSLNCFCRYICKVSKGILLTGHGGL